MASVFKRGRWTDAQGRKVATGTPGAKWQESKYWTVKVCFDGGEKRIKGYTDKSASLQLGAKMERDKAQGEQGLIDPYKAHRNRSLTEHVADYIGELRSLGRDAMYIYNADKRLAKLRESCGWLVLGNITADSFCRWRELPIEQQSAESEGGRIGPRTINQYFQTVRAFCNWAVKRKRMAVNPMSDVEPVDQSGDVRRERRALNAEDVAKLLAVIPEHHEGVYRFFLATGLRRQEVMDLQWQDVRVNAPSPFLQLRAKATKARRADVLPLRADVAAVLRDARGDAGDNDPVFRDLPTMEEHRRYLAAAGIPYKDADGRRLDIHGLRHTYGTLLSQAGVSPREAMSLMRHTDMRLTMKTYTDPRIFDLSGAVEKLPMPPHRNSPTEALATGTDGHPLPDAANNSAHQKRHQKRHQSIGPIGQSEASTGNQGGEGGHDVNPVTGSNWQQKTPSGKDGGKTGELGFEPRQADSETAVLPLHHSPKQHHHLVTFAYDFQMLNRQNGVVKPGRG